MTIPIHFHSADSINSLKSSLLGTTVFFHPPIKCKGLESSRKESLHAGQSATMCQEYSLIQCSYFYEADSVITSL